jgi:hypothetical protein
MPLDTQPRQAKAEAVVQDTRTTPKATLLVVDDEAAVRRVLVMRLQLAPRMARKPSPCSTRSSPISSCST